MKKNIALIILAVLLLASMIHSSVLRLEVDKQRELARQLQEQIELSEELAKKYEAIAEEEKQRAMIAELAARIAQDSIRQ